MIPSLVPGVELDSATWTTYARTMDLGAEDGIEYRVTLRSMRELPDTDIALIYETRTEKGIPMLLADAWLNVQQYSNEAHFLAFDPRLHKTGVPQDILTTVSGAFALKTGSGSSLRGCPAAVRVIPRRDLALYLRPDVAASDTRAKLVEQLRASSPPADTNPLRVLTVLRASQPGTNLFGVVVENTADTALTKLVVAMVVGFTDLEIERYKRRAVPDTIEYPIERLGPHEVVSMAGGHSSGERVVAVLTYPIDRVRGRRVADGAMMHRVSNMPRITRVAVQAPSGDVEVGTTIPVIAYALDSAGRRITSYDDLATHWEVESAESRAKLSEMVGRGAKVRADRIAHARVSATIAGVTGYANITFTTPSGFVELLPGFDIDGRRVLPDGTIEYLHGCIIHPDGKVEYPAWFPDAAARARKQPPSRTPGIAIAQARIMAEFKACKV